MKITSQGTSGLPSAVKKEINTPDKVISFTISSQLNGPTLVPIHLLNMVPCHQGTSLDMAPNISSQPVQQAERKLLKRPKNNSPTTENRNQARLMSQIQELQSTRSRRMRASRSRMRLFHGAVQTTESTVNSTLMQQAEAGKQPSAMERANNWVLVATGQTEDQRQVTLQAHSFLQHSPTRPVSRVAVVPLLRMNSTAAHTTSSNSSSSF